VKESESDNERQSGREREEDIEGWGGEGGRKGAREQKIWSERESETEREREREREKERERRERKREKNKKSKKECEREKARGREIQREREREGERECVCVCVRERREFRCVRVHVELRAQGKKSAVGSACDVHVCVRVCG